MALRDPGIPHGTGPVPDSFTLYVQRIPTYVDGGVPSDVHPFLFYVLWAVNNYHACQPVIATSQEACQSMVSSGYGIGFANPIKKPAKSKKGDVVIEDSEEENSDADGEDADDNDKASEDGHPKRSRLDSGSSQTADKPAGERIQTWTVKGNSYLVPGTQQCNYRCTMGIEQLLNRNGLVCGYRIRVNFHDPDIKFTEMLGNTFISMKTYTQALDEAQKLRRQNAKAFPSKHFPYLPANKSLLSVRDFKAHITGYLRFAGLPAHEISDYLHQRIPNADALADACRRSFQAHTDVMDVIVGILTDSVLEDKILHHLGVCADQTDNHDIGRFTFISNEQMCPYSLGGEGFLMPDGYQPSVMQIAEAMGLSTSEKHTMASLKCHRQPNLDMPLTTVPLHLWFAGALEKEYDRLLKRSLFLHTRRKIIHEVEHASTARVPAVLLRSVQQTVAGHAQAMAEDMRVTAEALATIQSRQIIAWTLVSSAEGLATSQLGRFGEAYVTALLLLYGKPSPVIPYLTPGVDQIRPLQPLPVELKESHRKIRSMTSADVITAYLATPEFPESMQVELDEEGRRGGNVIECMRMHLYWRAGISAEHIGSRMSATSQAVGSFLLMLTDGFGIWSMHYDVFLLYLVAISAGVPNDKGSYRAPVIFVGSPGAGKSFIFGIMQKLLPPGFSFYAGTETEKASIYRRWEDDCEGVKCYQELPPWLDTYGSSGPRGAGLAHVLSITEQKTAHERTVLSDKDGQPPRTMVTTKPYDPQLVIASNFKESSTNQGKGREDNALRDRCVFQNTPEPAGSHPSRSQLAFLNTIPHGSQQVVDAFWYMAIAMTTAGRARSMGLLPAPGTPFLDVALQGVVKAQRWLGLQKFSSRVVKTAIFQRYTTLVMFSAIHLAMMSPLAPTTGNNDEYERYEALCVGGIWGKGCAMFPDPLDPRLDRKTGRMCAEARGKYVFPDLVPYTDATGRTHVTPFVKKGPLSRNSDGRCLPRRNFPQDETTYRSLILHSKYFYGPNPDAFILTVTNQHSQHSYMQPGIARIVQAIFTTMGCSVKWLRTWVLWIEAWNRVQNIPAMVVRPASFEALLMGDKPLAWDPRNLMVPGREAVLVPPSFRPADATATGTFPSLSIGTEACFVSGSQFTGPIPVEPTSAQYHPDGTTVGKYVTKVRFLALDLNRASPAYIAASGTKTKPGTHRSDYWKVMYSWLTRVMQHGSGKDVLAALDMFTSQTFMEDMERLTSTTALLPVLPDVSTTVAVSMDVFASICHPRNWRGFKEQSFIRYGEDGIPYLNIFFVLLCDCHVEGGMFIRDSLLASLRDYGPGPRHVLTALPSAKSWHPAARSVWTAGGAMAAGEGAEVETVQATNPNYLPENLTADSGIMGSDYLGDPRGRAATSMGPGVTAISPTAHMYANSVRTLRRRDALDHWQREFNAGNNLFTLDGEVYEGNTQEAINAVLVRSQAEEPHLRTVKYPEMMMM